MKTAMELNHDAWECEILQDRLEEEQRQRVMEQGRSDKEKRMLEYKIQIANTYAGHLQDQLRRCRKPYKKHLIAMMPMALAVIVLILVQAFCNVNSSVLSTIATALFMGLSWCAATVWERTRSRKGGNRHDH